MKESNIATGSHPTWVIATSAKEIHALLCASDLQSATPQAPAPKRSVKTTEERIRSGAVHALMIGGDTLAAFTLTWQPSFSQDLVVFPPATKPAYISRLAVHPGQLAQRSMLGVRCIRRALELAEAAGADALRAEANPDLSRVFTLLLLHGFKEHFRREDEEGRKHAYLQREFE